MGYLIIIVVLFGLMWLFLIRPQKRRQVEQARLQDSIAAGDEILTAGGIHGTVRGDRRTRSSRSRSRRARSSASTAARSPPSCRNPSRSRKNDPDAGRPGFARRKLICCGPMSNRRSHLILVGLILAALAGVALLAIPGSPAHKKVTLGLDLQGGLEVVLKAVPPPGKTCDSACMDRSVSIMRSRIDKLGVSEPEIRKQGRTRS